MVFILMLLSRLPLSVLYLLARPVALIGSRFYRRQIVEENLRSCFPHWSSEKMEHVANKFYSRFSEFIMETVKGLSIDKDELRRRVHYLNPELVEEAGHDGPILIFAAHQMNWEWMSLASGLYFPFQSEVIYRPLTSKRSEQLMIRLRSRFGNRLLERDRSVRQLLKSRKETRAIGIVADQLPRQKYDKIWTTFLGRETPFYKGITELPYLLQAPAYFARIEQVARGYYEVEFVKIGSPPYKKGKMEVLRNYIIESEKMIASAPEGWLWTHRRWKYTREENEEMTIL